MQAHGQVEVACKLARSFALMLRERNAPALEPWLQEASNCAVAEMWTFAAGIKCDQAAAQAALTYSWSQGITEGKVNKLKTVKRQMWRAGFPLLRLRLLHAA